MLYTLNLYSAVYQLYLSIIGRDKSQTVGKNVCGIESESEVAESCPTLCDPMDCSLPGFSIHGIFQARVLGGLPFPSPGDLPDPGIELGSPAV